MDVALDTNVYFSLLTSQGRSFVNANLFVGLLTYLRRTRSELVIPAVVLEEITAKYRDLLGHSIKDARDRWTTLRRNTMSELVEPLEPDIAREVNAFKEVLLEPAKGFRSTVYDLYDRVSVEEVVRRGVHRIRPASDKGEELRDVVLWFLVLARAKESGRELAFVTDDGTFLGSDGKFHADLLADIKNFKVAIQHFRSISEFVTNNALASEPVTAEEIDPLVLKDDIAGLVIERLLEYQLTQGTVKNVELAPAQFREAQKYKVASDSFYVEAHFVTSARLFLEQRVSYVTYNLLSYAPTLSSASLGGMARHTPVNPWLMPGVAMNTPNVFAGVAQFSPVAVTGSPPEFPRIETSMAARSTSTCPCE